MRRVRAYSREERKRLIIHAFAEQIRLGHEPKLTCAGIAQMMDIVPSTKLRQILAEMVASELLVFVKEENAGIAPFRIVYELNYSKAGFSEPRKNAKAARRSHALLLNINGKVEALQL